MRPRLLRLSLSTRLALMFFSITLLAIAALYVFVAPGLKSRLVGSELSTLRTTARDRSGPLAATVGGSDPQARVHRLVTETSESTGYRVTLVEVNRVLGSMQLSRQMDSGGADSSAPVVLTLAWQAARTGRVSSGTAVENGINVAQSAVPVRVGHRVTAVVLYTTSIDILRTVSTVRDEILEAGACSLALALIAGWLIARAIAQRVRRLEVAAKQMAAGRFPGAIPVDSADELGQLAEAFNDMQRQLRQLDLARKKFIATASHELRTPLFSLSGFVELLEDEELDPETRRRFLDQVRDQVARLGKLSVDLLDLSRLEAGSLELRPEQVDLGELTALGLRRVRADPGPARRPAGAAAARRARGDPRPVRPGPPGPDHADPDRQRPHPHARRHPDPGHRGTLQRTRPGRGARRRRGDRRAVAAADLRAVLHRRRRTGIGLGLAIASELASRMSGRLLVESEPGETTFTLELPA